MEATTMPPGTEEPAESLDDRQEEGDVVETLGLVQGDRQLSLTVRGAPKPTGSKIKMMNAGVPADGQFDMDQVVRVETLAIVEKVEHVPQRDNDRRIIGLDVVTHLRPISVQRIVDEPES